MGEKFLNTNNKRGEINNKKSAKILLNFDFRIVFGIFDYKKTDKMYSGIYIAHSALSSTTYVMPNRTILYMNDEKISFA